VSNVVVDGHGLECDVTGSMEALLRVLVEAGVKHMTTREPSLEELFVSHYGNVPAPAARPASSG
jgi:ABC-2 type transport system ATP-binding protein